MKRFRFSLEKILRYKRLLKEQKQAELAKAYHEFHEHRRELERLGRLREEGRKSLLSGRLSPALIMHKVAYVALMDKRVSAQNAATEAAWQKVRERRDLLIEANKEEQILEKLKERKRQEYRHYVEVTMQKELDEVAASAFARRG